jgi:cysteine-rich repeat protein
LDGQILAQPVGPAGGHGGAITLRADGGIDIGSAGEVLVQGAYGGSTSVYSEGPVSFYGKIDARGTGFSSFGYDFGRGGYVTIGGRQDLKLGGMINSGGLKGADGDVNIDVCRLSMTASGRIDADFAGPTPHNPDVNITVHESMTTHANSSIFADKAGARNLITYRDPNKPPVLDGIIDPPPILNVNPSLVGCPVCGNSEIDQDESCDDGNMTSGDGCRSDCQDEGCIAATPGFPSTPLCDDGDACTADRCDPVAHACQNPVSCEEGVVCTVDACVAGACQHTPEDGLCDDANDCTDDLCNATTGCVHADLTGGSCEDGDYCTEAGACDDGDCIITDLSLATGNRLKVSLKTGPTNDVLKAIVNLPLAEFSANPATTGLRIVLVDSADQSIYEDDLPAAGWVDSGGAGRAFGYKDEVGAVRTVAKIKRNAATGLARSVVKVSGAEMPGASSQEALSLSLLFGTDPAIDECLTARRVPCTPKATSTSCRDD